MARAAFFIKCAQVMSVTATTVTCQYEVLFVDPNIDGGSSIDHFVYATIDLNATAAQTEVVIRNAIISRGNEITPTLPWANNDVYQFNVRRG